MITQTCFISLASLDAMQFSTDLLTKPMTNSNLQTGEQMHNFALTMGWTHFHSCMCPGYPERRYKHPELPQSVLKIYPTKKAWAYYDKFGRRSLSGNNEIFDVSLTKLTP
jgi:hypothetical protein